MSLALSTAHLQYRVGRNIYHSCCHAKKLLQAAFGAGAKPAKQIGQQSCAAWAAENLKSYALPATWQLLDRRYGLQVMAFGTLAACYNNPEVFQKVVKMRRGETAKYMTSLSTMHSTYLAFAHFACVILAK